MEKPDKPNIVLKGSEAVERRLIEIESRLTHFEEDKADRVQLVELEERVSETESEIKRLTTHIESEISLARRSTERIELKLFGDGTKEFGGAIGELRQRFWKNALRQAYVTGGAVAIIWIAEHFGLFKP